MKDNATGKKTNLKWQDGKILTKGYGQIATSFMDDDNITRDAKTLYVYLVCKTGSSEFCYPSNATIMKALGIKTKKSLSDYKYELTEKGLLRIEERKYKSGQLTSNKYFPAKMIRESE